MYESNDGDYKIICQNYVERLNNLSLSNLDTKRSSNQQDKIFSLEEDHQSRKRASTPDFNNDSFNTAIESPVMIKLNNLGYKKENSNKLSILTNSPRKTKNTDECFFKFKQLMFKDKLSSNSSNTSTQRSPDIRRMFTHPITYNFTHKQRKNDSLKRRTAHTPEAKTFNKYNYAFETKSNLLSPKKQLSTAFNISERKTISTIESDANLLEFVFNDEKDVSSLENHSSIEDDIVTTPTRHKELNRRGCKSDEFRIALYPAENKHEKMINKRLAVQRFSCNLLKNDINPEIGNLLDYSMQEQKEKDDDMYKIQRYLSFSPKTYPNKQARFKLHVGLRHLALVFENRVKTYVITINRNDDQVIQMRNLPSQYISLSLAENKDRNIYPRVMMANMLRKPENSNSDRLN